MTTTITSVAGRKAHLTTKRGFVPGEVMGEVIRFPPATAEGAMHPDCTAISRDPYDTVRYYDRLWRLVEELKIDWSRPQSK